MLIQVTNQNQIKATLNILEDLYFVFSKPKNDLLNSIKNYIVIDNNKIINDDSHIQNINNQDIINFRELKNRYKSGEDII